MGVFMDIIHEMERFKRGKVKMLTICDCFQKVWQSLLYESNNCHCKSLFTFTLLPFEFAPNIKVAKIWKRQINLFEIQPGNKIQPGNNYTVKLFLGYFSGLGPKMQNRNWCCLLHYVNQGQYWTSVNIEQHIKAHFGIL